MDKQDLQDSSIRSNRVLAASQEHNRQHDQTVRVLLIAEECNPEWTSVPLEGFNYYNAIRQVADVTLVTQVRNRSAFERRGERLQDVAFIDSERIAKPFHRLGEILTLGRGLGWTTKQAATWIPYLYFEFQVFERFRDVLKRGCFDLIHRVTPLSPTYPSPMASWTSVPLVLGPLNGGLPWPRGTTRVRLTEMEWLSYLREIYRLLPYCRSTYERAACILAGSTYTLASLPRRARTRALYFPENGVDPACFFPDGRIPPSRIEPFRIAFCGRLVPYKGADIVLEAVGSSNILRHSTEIVLAGDGPQRTGLQSLARSLGIESRTQFAGQLPQAQVARLFRESSVFAFPSLREFGGAVVIEAMACGLPCIVADYGGPAEHVTDEVGLRLPLGSKPELVEAMQNALESLHEDRIRLDTMSTRGIARAHGVYAWEAKAVRIRQVYESVVQASDR